MNRTIYPCKLNRGFGFKSLENYLDQEAHEKGQCTQSLKCYDNNNKDRDKKPNINTVNNANLSSYKFRQKKKMFFCQLEKKKILKYWTSL